MACGLGGSWPIAIASMEGQLVGLCWLLVHVVRWYTFRDTRRCFDEVLNINLDDTSTQFGKTLCYMRLGVSRSTAYLVESTKNRKINYQTNNQSERASSTIMNLFTILESLPVRTVEFLSKKTGPKEARHG